VSAVTNYPVPSKSKGQGLRLTTIRAYNPGHTDTDLTKANNVLNSRWRYIRHFINFTRTLLLFPWAIYFTLIAYSTWTFQERVRAPSV